MILLKILMLSVKKMQKMSFFTIVPFDYFSKKSGKYCFT